MIRKKTYFYLLILLIISAYSYAQQSKISNIEQSFSFPNDSSLVCSNERTIVIEDSITINKTLSFTALNQKNNSIVYPLNYKSYRRLGYNTALYMGVAVVTFSVLWVMPEDATNWNKQEMKEQGLFYKWKENVKAGPVMDENSYFINYILHPYAGGIYYMTARSSGFNIFKSFTYSALMSTFFWEYGIEAFAEIPSIQDLIVTPVLGSAVGEGFFYAKKSILKNDKRVLNSRFLGTTTLFLIDPSNTLLDTLGYKDKIKTQMNIAPVGFDTSSNKTVWGVNFSASF